MDLRKLKTLIDLVQQSGIGEIEITEGEEKVRISRGVPGAVVQTAQPGTLFALPPGPQAVPPPSRARPPRRPKRRGTP